MCKTIELKSGARWTVLRKARNQDLASGEMVVVCPRCHIAFVVEEREVKTADSEVSTISVHQ